MFTVSLPTRAEKVTLAPVLSAGNIAILVSLVAHVGFAAVAIHHAHHGYRVDTQALLAEPSDAHTDDVDLIEPSEPVEPAEPTREPAPRVAAAVTPPVSNAHAAAAAPRAEPASAALPSAPPAAPSVATAAEPSVPHFAMLAPVVGAAVSAPVSGSSASSSAANGSGSAVVQAGPFAESSVDAPAKLLNGAPPRYTAAAESAGVEAEVPLEVVINAAGSVQNARPLAHVGYGLDEAALSAVRSYRFSPARRAGELVAVRMRWVMRFQLR